jgi:hypothetical protein
VSSTPAPERLVSWWRTYKKSHKTFPFEVSYHPRSDEHSKILCHYVLEDLIDASETLERQLLSGEICYDLNHVVYRLDGSQKVLDLVIGQPEKPKTRQKTQRGTVVTPGIRIALEAKACMTKHTAAKPRLRDELTGSMRSSVEASPHAVVAGLVVVNTAPRFLSPTDQPDPLPPSLPELRRRDHRQPKDAAGVIQMLERLPLRQDPPVVGFDSVGIIVVSHDNELPVPHVELVTSPPCPPPASPRNYASFIIDICNKYQRRFG